MIARKSALIIATQIANGILGYIGLKFIALYMEPWQYGVVGFAFGLVSVVSIFGRLGFQKAHIKRVSEGRDLGTCIATFGSIKLVLVGLMTAIVIIGVAGWEYILGRGFESLLHQQAVYVMLAYFVLFTLSQTFIFTFKARKEIAKAMLPMFAYNLGRIGATVFIAVSDLGALALAYAYLFGEIFEFALAFYFFRKYPVGKPTASSVKSYISFAMPMAVVVASLILMRNIDKVFIQLFMYAEDVGHYFAISNLSRFVILFVGAVGTLIFPTISKHHASKNMREIERLTLISERYLSMIVFPMVVLMVVLAEPIIRVLLSNKYLPVVTVLQILPFFVLMEALTKPYDTQLSGMNLPRLNRNRVIIMAGSNVLLNLLLIPPDIKSIGLQTAGFGVEGAAIATVAAYGIGLAYIRYVAWRTTGIKANPRIALHAVAAGGMALALYYVNTMVHFGRWYELMFAGLLGLGIYVFLLFIMKEFTREDYDLFMDTLNVKKMIEYIREEITGK
jgi:O-antigen/teichoic acid export membrane protein